MRSRLGPPRSETPIVFRQASVVLGTGLLDGIVDAVLLGASAVAMEC